MGCGASSQSATPRQLVLLGGGECGKTTIFKQIQILHGHGFPAKGDWVDAILRSIGRVMKEIIRVLKESEKYDDFELKEQLQRIDTWLATANELSVEGGADVAAVWEHPAVRALVAERAHRLDLDDNAAHFLDRVREIASPDFVPTDADILKVRDPTRTIETLDFTKNRAKFRVIDVGGQRMERPKWNLTGDISAVIFVCSLTEYNQVLREDIKQNRLKESLNLFDIACNRRYPEKPIILFFNKKDLFAELIKKTDLRACFPTYTGGNDYDAALEFIKNRFLTLSKDKTKPIYMMETTATDTGNMDHILNSMISIVEKENLAAYERLT